MQQSKMALEQYDKCHIAVYCGILEKEQDKIGYAKGKEQEKELTSSICYSKE